jgi:ATP-dependent DNA helicase RecG
VIVLTGVLQELMAGGESHRTEFKRAVNLDAIGTTVASFLNADGGTLLVGVDHNGLPVGVPEAPAAVRRIESDLARRLSPQAPYSVSVEDIDGKTLLVVTVPPGGNGPYVFNGRVPIRRGNVSVSSTAEELTALILGKRGSPPRWERLPALGVALSDLDREEISRFADDASQLHGEGFAAGRDPEEILDRLALASPGAVLNSAVVLFGKNPARVYPQTRVRVTHFIGESTSRLVSDRVLEGHAFALQRQIQEFFERESPLVVDLPERGFQRTARPAYPWSVLREGVVNALAHRDYAAYDGGIRISVFADRLEVWNSGELPTGWTVADLKRGAGSRPPNPDIAHAFYLRGVMERFGIGARRMVEACRDAGLPEPDWSLQGGGILLTLRLESPFRVTVQGDLGTRVLRALAALAPGEAVATPDYHRRFAAEVSERQAREDLARLVSLGYMTRLGAGRATRYIRTERQAA